MKLFPRIVFCIGALIGGYFLFYLSGETEEPNLVRDTRGGSPLEIVTDRTPINKTKLILGWTKFFGAGFAIYQKHRRVTRPFDMCPYKACEWTYDKSRIYDADAVVMHIFPKDFYLSQLPQYRNSAQRWVFLNLEPPIRFREGAMSSIRYMFNLTATYEDDADISVPYGYFWKRSSPLADKYIMPDLTTKNKSVVWMVSRCNTLSRREVYAEDLKKYIDIDIFGACGRPAPKKGSPPINLDFRTELARQYYFYLAFENSDCVDYITEKFWSSLAAGIVPIVRGQLPRYEKHAPPGSFINADSFFSYEDLADYLKYLIANPEQYKKYFEWKRWYHAETVGAFQNLNIHCRLCEILHTQPNLQQTYDMMQRYSQKEKCFNYHENLDFIHFEVEKAYNDEFKDFLPINQV